jgi:hypothetical protein
MTSLAELLAPYRLPTSRSDASGRGLPGSAGWRFRHAPPRVTAHALDLAEEPGAGSGTAGRPPPAWLVRTARDLEGRLAGFAAPEGDGGHVRVDGITVPRARRHDLVRAVAAAWPAGDDGAPGALALAVAEVYRDWGSAGVTWKGPGTALTGRVSRGAVVGLWWG